MQEIKYNLFYSDGGHSGPCDESAAKMYAKIYVKGFDDSTNRIVEIRPTTSDDTGGFSFNNPDSKYISTRTVVLDELRAKVIQAKNVGLTLEDILKTII